MMLLRKCYPPEALQGMLRPYQPFPRWGEENPLTDEQKARMIAGGEAYLGYTWPVPLATDYMKYATEGDRGPYEGANYTTRRIALAALADAEYAEQKGRFIPDMINGVWAMMDEATWVVPAHNGRELPDVSQPVFIDLFSAGTAGLLTDIYYLFKKPMDAVSPLVTARMEKVMEERILGPFMSNLYWWSGLAGRDTCNWGPWIISNVLTVFAVFCGDTARRASAVSFACLQLDQFIKLYGEDGGCDEGPSYWGHAAASLFDCLCILCDMTGDAFAWLFQEPLIHRLGTYICHANVSGGQFTNYEDAHFHFRVSYDLVFRFGRKIHSPMMEQFGVALYRLYAAQDGGARAVRPGIHNHYRYMQELCTFSTLDAAGAGAFPLEESVWLPDLEMIAERQTGGSDRGLYLSAKAGMNNISHNHNDIGSFMLFSDGQPAFVDIGSGKYTSQTFSDRRYEIFWTTSAYHNLPMVNGQEQMTCCTAKVTRDVSYTREDGRTVFSADIAACYPAQAGLRTLRRTCVFDRPAACVTVTDSLVWEGEDNRVEFAFITPTCPVVEDGRLVVPVKNGRDVAMTFPQDMTVQVQQVSTGGDTALEECWGECLYRTLVCARCGKEKTAVFTFTQCEA